PLISSMASLKARPVVRTVVGCIAALLAAFVIIAVLSPDLTNRNAWEALGPIFLPRAGALCITAVAFLLLLRRIPDSRKELAELKLRYDTLLQALPQYVAIKDRNKKFIQVSPGFCKFVGRTEAQILNKTDHDLFVTDHAKNFQKDDDLVLTGEVEELTKDEEENCVKGGKLDGKRRYTSVKKVPVLNLEGEIVGVQVMFLDVTKEKEEKHRLLRFFLHDAPKPLILIRDNSLMRLTAGLKGADSALVKDCTRIAKGIELLLANFDAYGFVGKSGTYEWKWESNGIEFNLEDVLDTVLVGARPNRDDIRFRKQQFRETQNIKIQTDKYKVMAMANLLVDNAVKALNNREEKLISLDLYVDGSDLHLRVEDTGCGIAKENLKQIYTDGYSTFGSSGLGLHIVKAFAELSGGDIQCESTVGKGTAFTVVIKKFKIL
ncbi:MAG: PAS domain-containing sensor histidine kinase, partial [Limisphaerales bacterium]